MGTQSKIVLVGLDNPQSRDPRYALYPWPPNCAGYRLMNIMGLRRREYLSLFERDNLFPLCPKYGGVSEATAKVEELLERHERARKFVLFGGEVVTALVNASNVRDGRQDWFRFYSEYFEPLDRDETLVAFCPHPSGRNRWWNDLSNRVRAERFFDELIREARG